LASVREHYEGSNFRFSRSHSFLSPKGELGDVHVVKAIALIPRAMFAEWISGPMDDLGRFEQLREKYEAEFNAINRGVRGMNEGDA